MAEPTAMNVQGMNDIVRMHEEKEMRDAEKTVVDSSKADASQSGQSGSGDIDPLGHLPEHFRKEIEAQATLKSRKVSFRVDLCSSDDDSRNSFGSLDRERSS